MSPRSTLSSRTLLARVRGQGDDAGVVMVVVILSMIMVTAFVTSGLAYGIATQKQSRGDQDFNAALAAAQAGVEDYIAQLNRNDNYARQATFTDCANLAIKGPLAPTPNSCGWDAKPGWKQINPAEPNGPQFHYDVDGTQLNAKGTIKVASTGRVNRVTRTLEVAVGRGGSTDFLYYTDHEDADPDNVVSYPPSSYPSGMRKACYNYWWGQARDQPDSTLTSPRRLTSTQSPRCAEISFTGGDVFDGKAHMNDTPSMQNNSAGVQPLFKQGLETSDPKCKLSVRTDPASWKNCDRTGNGANYGTSYPTYEDVLYLEDSSAAFASHPGCSYMGATRIILNADGTMKVWSKDTPTGPPACGGNRPNGAVVPVPDNQVVYVKNAPSVRYCKAQEIDGVLPLGTYTGDTRQLSFTYDENMVLPEQRCGLGNLWVHGTLKGALTLATQNNIVVTGDLKLAREVNGSDLLGLVAGNSVEVFQPILGKFTCSDSNDGRCNRYSGPTSSAEPPGWPVNVTPRPGQPVGVEINAAIQTLQHSFTVQSYDRFSAKGKLTVNGSIAQKWRGAVGTGNNSTGYLKDYRYDIRLKYSSPPYFPGFVNAKWSGRATGELSPQYGGP